MPDIKEWIRGQLKASVPPEKIKQGLIEGGYNPNLINEVLTENTKGQNINLTTTLMPQPSNIKIVFLVILLAGTSFVLGGALTFSLLNTDTEPEIIIQPTFLTYDELVDRNPKLALFTKDVICRENLGFTYTFLGGALHERLRVVLLTFKDEVIGVLSIWPASQEWFAYADETEGNPTDFGGALYYTQTIYFSDPPSQEDCVAAINQ